jgi:hypothetical protein
MAETGIGNRFQFAGIRQLQNADRTVAGGDCASMGESRISDAMAAIARHDNLSNEETP